MQIFIKCSLAVNWMQSFVNRLWYGHLNMAQYIVVLLLLPFSGLFYVITALRRLLFRQGIKSTVSLPVPVIVVGNITVGGSGKTPMVIYLVEMLRRHGYRPGVISRGYGVRFNGVRRVTSGMSTAQVGDEPVLIVGRTAVPMVIGSCRVQAAEMLLKEEKVDIIISDDGLQHYHLKRDIELLLLDAERRFGNGFLLPAGPLREGIWRQNTVDYTIATGQSDSLDELVMTLESADWKPVNSSVTSKFCHHSSAVALAGIGNPQRFFNTLEQMDVVTVQQYIFEDHHSYSYDEIIALVGDAMVLMTEKDAVKCREFAKKNWWYLPVDAQVTPNFERQLIGQLQKL